MQERILLVPNGSSSVPCTTNEGGEAYYFTEGKEAALAISRKSRKPAFSGD